MWVAAGATATTAAKPLVTVSACVCAMGSSMKWEEWEGNAGF